MALVKSVRSSFGIDGDYWRIIGIETWYGGPNQVWPSASAMPVTFVHVAQYASKAARQEGAMSLQVKKIILNGEDGPAPLDDPTRAAAYTALKELAEFNDATDDV